MSWIDDMTSLMRKGLERQPSATEALVLFARTHSAHNITLEQAVERLTPSCRGQARRILRDARDTRASDIKICQ
ncbi:MAG: hypothetical protein WC654_02715, partial [Patescibacteria group bacterium]